MSTGKLVRIRAFIVYVSCWTQISSSLTYTWLGIELVHGLALAAWEAHHLTSHLLKVNDEQLLLSTIKEPTLVSHGRP